MLWPSGTTPEQLLPGSASHLRSRNPFMIWLYCATSCVVQQGSPNRLMRTKNQTKRNHARHSSIQAAGCRSWVLLAALQAAAAAAYSACHYNASKQEAGDAWNWKVKRVHTLWLILWRVCGQNHVEHGVCLPLEPEGRASRPLPGKASRPLPAEFLK